MAEGIFEPGEIPETIGTPEEQGATLVVTPRETIAGMYERYGEIIKSMNPNGREQQY